MLRKAIKENHDYYANDANGYNISTRSIKNSLHFGAQNNCWKKVKLDVLHTSSTFRIGVCLEQFLLIILKTSESWWGFVKNSINMPQILMETYAPAKEFT